MSIDVMKQALDALENHTAIKHPQQRAYRDDAITALRAAIEQAQEPVAWAVELPDGTRKPLYTRPARQPQEPVAWANRVIGGKKWLSIHASKGASDRWLEYRRKEQAQGEQYEQHALYAAHGTEGKL